MPRSGGQVYQTLVAPAARPATAHPVSNAHYEVPYTKSSGRQWFVRLNARAVPNTEQAQRTSRAPLGKFEL